MSFDSALTTAVLEWLRKDGWGRSSEWGVHDHPDPFVVIDAVCAVLHEWYPEGDTIPKSELHSAYSGTVFAGRPPRPFPVDADGNPIDEYGEPRDDRGWLDKHVPITDVPMRGTIEGQR
jgi:hypothetical protein